MKTTAASMASHGQPLRSGASGYPSQTMGVQAVQGFASKRVVGGSAKVKGAAASQGLVPLKGAGGASRGRGYQQGAGAGLCTLCTRPCREVGQDGKRYCLNCLDDWDKQRVEMMEVAKKVVARKADEEKAEVAKAAAEGRAEEIRAKKAAAEQEQAADRSAAQAAARQGALARAQAGANGADAGPSEFFICGSWDNWVPHEMIYNHGRGCHLIKISLGESGQESFRLLVDGDEERCLLDEDGVAKTWCIGESSEDEAAPGVFYEVVLRTDAQGAASVEWARLGKQSPAPARRYWIGNWDKSTAHEMDWDPLRQCFHCFVQLGRTKEESFQIFVNADRDLCIYPEWPHGNFHCGDAMWGPDANHHGKSWTIGRHPLDQGDEGTCYEVRLRLKPDGTARYVDWVKLDASGVDAESLPETVDCEEAVRLYGQRIAEKNEDLAASSGDETAEPSQSGSGSSETEEAEASAEARAELERDLAEYDSQALNKGFDMEVDSDGEEVRLCRHCCLPLGDFGYAPTEGDECLVHGECMAQKVIDDMRKEDDKRKQEDAALKKKERAEYDIGWKVERIPRSLCLAKKLNCCPTVPQGMCCLVLDRDSNSVRIAPTMEPAASVNLAYLAVALQVRLREGTEPWFSLDPVDADRANGDVERSMQVKNFQPEWLAGTRVGEVLFQADYHLKELSMGEYAQPVLGMKSCHDFAETDGLDKEWSAREWFVINKAQVQISDDDVLLPYVRMGVEAREQIKGEHGLEDARITRPDHPMVKYAELFTENFDLIAERKSVVFHLREVAKATVMAKYLIDARVNLDDCWFSMAEEEVSTCVMEIPQLWNERAYSKVHVQDGQIRGIDEGIAPQTHGVYGGVQLAVPGVPAMVPGVPVAMAAVAPTRQAARIAPAVVGVSAMGRLVRAGPGGAAIRPGPKGVDLNLGQFDLSEAADVKAVEGDWAGNFQCSDPSLAVGGAFWSSLNVMKDADKSLFNAVFNPMLSDRREEGDCFVPPDTCPSHLRKLKELVQAEEKLRQERKSHFFSISFTTDNVGPLFPRSWSSTIEIARNSARSLMRLRPDFKCEAALDQALKSASPSFDKTTEDGLRFRVYRIGSLEVRTTQEPDGQEVVGAVLSTRAPEKASPDQAINDQDKLVKVTEYVELAQCSANRYRHYVVFQTESGTIVTELLADGAVAFEVAPADLEVRTSLAKVLRSANCRSERISVGDMRKYVDAKRATVGASDSMRKRFARGVFKRVGGEARTKMQSKA